MKRSLQVGVFLTILFAYLLGEGRTPPFNDSKVIYSVAESMVDRQAVDVPVPGGKLYAQQPLLPSAIHVPGVLLRKAIAKGDPSVDRLIKPITSHLGTQVMVVAGCLVFFRFLLYLGISLAGASLGTFMLAFATFLPIYSRSTWSEALQTACFIGFFSSLVRLRDDPRRGTGLWFGLWTGMLVNSKYVFVLALPGALVFLLVHAYRTNRVRPVLRALAWPFLPGAVFLISMLWYNWARTGSLISSGYPSLAGLSDTVLRENLFVGLWSYCFSFGKSIFLYNPPLALGVVGFPLLLRRRASLGWAMLLTAAPIVCLYSKFVFWSGDWCWGPRYLLFVVPPLLLPAVFLVDELLVARRWVRLSLCGAVVLLGVGVQFVGASQYWDHFIRFSKSAQLRWLGYPNRGGALTPDHGGSCDPCFEDFYARNYTPALQPIETQWWLLKHRMLSHPWEVAARDLPLRRYTNLDFPNAEPWYQKPPWDWWRFDFVGRYYWTGSILLTVFLLGLAAGLFLWARGLRAAYRRAGPEAGS